MDIQVFIIFRDIHLKGSKSFFILNNKVSWKKDYQASDIYISPQCQKYIEKE